MLNIHVEHVSIGADQLNRIIRWILISLGVWISIDGLGSIAIYWAQSPIEHLVRLLRTLVGCVVIWMAVKGR